MNALTVRSLVKLSVFAVVTTLITVVLGVTIANGGTRNGVPYRAEFADATSLLKGDDVRVAGVRVGQVTGVSIARSGRTALVRFVVDRAVPLFRGTRAEIRYRNLVGQRYVALVEQAGGDTARLPRGSTIPLERTKPPLDLTVLFNGFRPLFRGLEPHDVNAFALEVVKTLQGEGGTVDDLIARTASLTNALANRDRVIGDLIDNLTSVLTTVDNRRQGLDQTIVTLQQLVSGLASDRTTIAGALGNVNALASSTASLLQQVRPPLPADLAALSAVTRTLDTTTDSKGRNVLKQTLVQYPAKLNTLIRTATYGSWFNFWLCGAETRDGQGQRSPVRLASRDAVCRP